MFSNAVALGQLVRPEEALLVYDELLTQCAEAPEPALRKLLDAALRERDRLEPREA